MREMKHILKKIGILLIGGSLILSACAGPELQNKNLNFQKVQDIAIFTNSYVSKTTNDVVSENLLIDIQNKNVETIDTNNINFIDIFPSGERMSISQYYKDRLIIGDLNGGGKSVEIIQKNGQQIEIQTHDFNILFYDDAQQKYITQDKEGFNILNNELEKIDFIPLPVSIDKINMGSIYPYNLDTFLYVGDFNGEKFQVLKYDVNQQTWVNIAQLLEPDVYEGYMGYAYMSYNERYPDWASFTMGALFSQDKPKKDINALFFVNLKTGEVKKSDFPLSLYNDRAILSMPYMKNSVIQTKDRVVILDMNPEGVQVMNELYVENLAPASDQHINSVVQLNDDYMVISTPEGLIKYSFVTQEADYIYVGIAKN